VVVAALEKQDNRFHFLAADVFRLPGARVIEYVVKAIDNGTEIALPKPTPLRESLDVLLQRAGKKTAGYLYVRLDLPRRPRTTGPRSQNNRFYGQSEDLAQQVVDGQGEPIYSKDQIHDAMLRMSVPEGYPTYLDLNGVETPLPSSLASVEQMSLVNRVIQRYADTHGFWLHEYVPDGPHKGEVYRSIGGRSYEEMQRYWEGK